MANGIAVGGFATGLSQGLQSGFNMASAIEKDKRDQAMFELQKEKMEMERDEARRKKAMQDQIARDLTAIDQRVTGGVVGGEATDEFGTDLGKLVYATPADAKASGLKFKSGTTVDKAPENLSEYDVTRLKAAVFQKARIDHGFMDEESFDRQRKINKELKKEGFEDAYRYFLETGDSDGAVAKYASMGKQNRVPPGTFMRREVDPDTGVVDVGVYAPGANGQPQKITSMFEFQLANMPEELVRYAAGMKKEKFVQGEANKRVDKQEAGQDRRSNNKISSDRALKLADLRNDENKTLATTLNNRFTAIFRNPTTQMEADRNKMIESEVGMLARNLMDAGMNMQTAINVAQDRVFKKYNVNTEPLQPPKN